MEQARNILKNTGQNVDIIIARSPESTKEKPQVCWFGLSARVSIEEPNFAFDFISFSFYKTRTVCETHEYILKMIFAKPFTKTECMLLFIIDFLQTIMNHTALYLDVKYFIISRFRSPCQEGREGYL